MTRAEALKLNKRYQLSDEVKEILRSKELDCSIYVLRPRWFFCSACYVVEIEGLCEYIDFSEFHGNSSTFDRYARKILCTLGYIK